MPHMRKGIFGLTAISLLLGAAQFAFGHDLTESIQALSSEPSTGVNRAAKADRAAAFMAPSAPTRTISLKFDGLAETSVLVRIPLALENSNAALPSLMQKPGEQKSTLACEPVVSVLTEVAKRLQPGRCIT